MPPRPTIFISAVSKELKGARQLVANTLQFLGYEPVWQDIFGTEQGDLRQVLREKIDECNAVVQLVGKSYGAEPPEPDEQFGRVSYSQYEALYAKARGKKVWYLFLNDDFPADAHEVEPEELRELQAAYRRRLQSEAHLYHPVGSPEALEASVLKLRDDLTRLRRGFKQWAIGVAAVLILLTGLVLLVLHGQQKQGQQVGSLIERNRKMEQALERLAEVESREIEQGEKLTPAEQRVRAYAELENDLGLERGSLAKELPAFALELYNRSDTTLMMRARAAYALNKFEEAEKLSAEAANQDQQAYENAKQVAAERRQKAIEDFDLAGQSADKRIQYADALKYYRAAADLTDRDGAPMEWAQQQWNIAHVLLEQGKYEDSETVCRSALTIYQSVHEPENKDALELRSCLARALVYEGKYANAEKEIREVLKVRENVLGAEDPETLHSRDNLASTFLFQGKFPEAEAEYRTVIKIEEKTLGPEHPRTLATRMNLSTSLEDQGRYDEAENEDRAVIKLKEKSLGAENPDTLSSRNNLAADLAEQGKYAEAEKEYSEVFKLREKVLGPEHPDTLTSRMNLAIALDREGKYDEAETEFREVLKIKERVLHPENPETLRSRNNLAAFLRGRGRYVEAETEYRAVLKLREEVLTPSHPDTLNTCYGLGLCLQAENKMDEAKVYAQRAADGAKKVLRASNPNRLKYEKFLQELQTTNSP